MAGLEPALIRKSLIEAVTNFYGEAPSLLRILRIEPTMNGHQVSFLYHIFFDSDYAGTAILDDQCKIISIDMGMGGR